LGFNLQTGEWCVHNRLFNAKFDDKKSFQNCLLGAQLLLPPD
jgi:hypothetical protein